MGNISSLVKSNNNNNNNFIVKTVVEPVVEPVVEEKIIKEPKIKHCSFCNNTNHIISKCQIVNDAMYDITNKLKNNNDIVSARKYLQNINKILLKRYISVNSINKYMYRNCSIYYDNNISKLKDKDIELIIGYLCVLPFHPEIKIQREYKSNKVSNKVCNNEQNNSLFGGMLLVSNRNGVGLGFKL